MVLVPGGPGLTNEAYGELTDGLASTVTVVTYQQRGTHPLPPNDYPRTVSEYADELATVIDAVRSRDPGMPICVFGHSFGAAIVIDALASGLRVDGAVIMGAFSSGRMIKAGVMERVAALPHEFHDRYAALDPDDAAGLSALIAEFWFPRHFCTVDPWPAQLQAALGTLNGELLVHFLGPNLLDLQGEVMNWDRSTDLSAIAVPLLIMGGVADYMTPDQAREMHAAFPDSEIWIGESSSHCPWLEQPDETFARIDRFINDRVASGAGRGE
jgi:proline iminopeptidase